MVRHILCLLIISLGTLGVYSQDIQVMSEDFNRTTHIFDLNTGEVGDDVGPNEWIVNDEFIGTPLYPNTIPQDSIASGTINGAPYSNYLHIHDSEASQTDNISNANYNPDTASDRFAHFDETICTKSLFNVTLTFYYLVQGNEDAYGEVYYSKDFGPWIQIGPDKLNNAPIWQRIDIQDPGINNAEDLRFGFRWVNTDDSGPKSTSLSIDEVIVVADYDEENNPVEITSEPVNDTACRGQSAQVSFDLSDTLCEGTYLFEYSEAGGSFQNPQSIGTITWFPIFGTPANITIPVPNDLETGECYRIRVTRTEPPPIITGEISGCLTIVDCPPDVSTNQPPVTIGSGPGGGSGGGGLGDGYVLCAGSAMDIPFNSDGTINQDNEYVGLISNELDTLSDGTVVLVNAETVGSMPDPNDYPGMPGTVGGTVPQDLEPGCGYYVQVNSTSPQAYGTVYGPFCVKKCDITTNDNVDISACVTDTSGFQIKIPVEINSWTDTTDYDQNNEFLVQVLDMQSLGVINTGALGAELTDSLDSLLLDIPDLQQLLSLGIAPGTYYMRIIATNNNAANDTLGTIVRLTIGHIPVEPPTAIAEDEERCINSSVRFFVSPYDNESTYEWQIADGRKFGPYQSNSFRILANAPSDVIMRVREHNYGCVSEWSNWDTTAIISIPQAILQIPEQVCIGDTVDLSATFYERTFYAWGIEGNSDLIEGSEVLELGNNEASIVFDSIGQEVVTLRVLNSCGSDFSPKGIVVNDYPDTDAGQDTTVCVGEPVEVTAKPDNMKKYFWLRNNSIVTDDSVISTTVNSEKTYVLYAENDGGCGARDTVTFYPAEPPEPTTDSVKACEGDTASFGTDYEDATHRWNTGEETDSIAALEEGDYSVTITNSGDPCPIEKNYKVGFQRCEATFDVPNAFTPNGDGLNDHFTVVGEYFDVLEMRIYNRWGELMYRTTDIEEGWDGEFRGKPADPGVYTYVVRYEDDFGEEKTETGNVTLIR